MLNRAFWITGVISVALLSACETVKQTENVGPNNATALAAIAAAYARASEQKSYRAQLTLTDSDGKVTNGTIDYVAPSNAHMVMKIDGKGQTLEHILYNGSLYIKAEKQWVRSPVATDRILEQVRKDPQTLPTFMKTISGAQILGAESVNGKSATAYRYYQAGQIAGGLGSTKGWVKLWVGSNGLPLKLESDAETTVMFMGGRAKSSILYTDYGAAIRIAVPPV